MLSMAQRFSPATEPVIVRQGLCRTKLVDPALYGAIRRAYELQAQLRALEPGLKEAKALIAARTEALAPSGRGMAMTVTLEAGDMLCTISRRHEALVPEENVRKLRKILGRNFSSLVRERKKLTATRELVSTAGDEALELLTLKELAPQFRWALARPPKD